MKNGLYVDRTNGADRATGQPGTSVAVADGPNLSPLRAKAGLLRRLSAHAAVSAAAGQELSRVEVARVHVEGAIALTGLRLAEAKIKTALVATAMPQVGALAVALNSQTTSVDQTLTNSAAAEVVTHLTNRSANVDLAQELRQGGKISDEESATLEAFATNDAALDIERSRARMADAKQAVQCLHDYALASIAKAKMSVE